MVTYLPRLYTFEESNSESVMKSFIIIFLCLLFVSCNETNGPLTDSTDEVPSESVLIPLSPINSQIVMSIREEITSSKRNVILSFCTTELYSPAGAKIIGSINKENNIIQVDLQDIKMPEAGAAISTPASVSFMLDSIPNDNYSLQITINGKKVIGLIKVSDESFEIKTQPNNIISYQQNNLLRIPENIIWGQSESIQQSTYKQFLDSLKIFGAKAHNLKPGDYSYFEIDSQGNFNTHSALGMSFGEFFLFSFQGDTLITRSLIKRFSKRYLDSIYIQFSGGRGEMYYSTVLRNEP